MLFSIICTDKPGEGLELRMKNRPDHLAFLDQLGDRLKMAGPFMNDEGTEPRGSLVIIEAENIDEARTIAARDPYARAGVFENVEIRAFKWLLPEEKS
jgi:uncharacterized protein YciI